MPRFEPWLMMLAATVLLAPLPRAASAETVFINEIHYDNTSADAGEAIEIAGPAGTDLNGWELVLYNGSSSQRSVYQTTSIDGVIPDQQAGFGTLHFEYPSDGIQNGAPDGVALVDALGKIVQFLSYEGSFVAADGPAAGLPSSDIGVWEPGTTPVGYSLQLAGRGTQYRDFLWSATAPDTFGAANTVQYFSTYIDSYPICEIQGSGHVSPRVGEEVETSGLVTRVESNGFYLQDPTGDGDPNTSDGIFVYTQSSPTQSVADSITLRATVSEYVPGGVSTGNLSITELVNPVITWNGGGVALPAATLIGPGGRTPPTEIIDDDSLTLYQPSSDGIDFYESLEGMRVRLEDSVAVSPVGPYSEVYAVGDGARSATGTNLRGGLTVTPRDFNPERIKIRFSAAFAPDFALEVGDSMGDVVGVVSYRYGSFELLPTETFTAASGSLAVETVAWTGDQTHLTVASFNVDNLDPGDGDRIHRLGDQIANRLRAPDIIGLQEIQDNDGSSDSGIVDASLTYQALIDAIEAAGGPAYAFLDIAPVDGQDGGEPGGNIRVGYLYNDDRVSYVMGSLQRILDVNLSDGDAFKSSRKPLLARFTFLDTTLTLVNNHLTSRSGSDPLFGAIQPPEVGGAGRREAQAAQVKALLDGLLDADPDVLVIVLGDMNEFGFGAPLATLTGPDDSKLLENLSQLLDERERYSYLYQGNSQQLDHILASPRLYAAVELDIVHLNAELADPASDHDPVVARFDIAAVPEPDRLHQLAGALLALALLKTRRMLEPRPAAAQPGPGAYGQETRLGATSSASHS
jgi:predicted extracellular nuclease